MYRFPPACMIDDSSDLELIKLSVGTVKSSRWRILVLGILDVESVAVEQGRAGPLATSIARKYTTAAPTRILQQPRQTKRAQCYQSVLPGMDPIPQSKDLSLHEPDLILPSEYFIM